jgi:trans-aconitate methyltransferase
MMTTFKPIGWIVVFLAISITAASNGAAQNRGKFKPLDVPFAGTPPAGIELMLRMAKTGPRDIVYDLGSGDGRIVIAAVRDFGAKSAVGIDIDRQRVIEGARNAAKAGVAEKTAFIVDDIFRSDFSEATVVTLFMSHRINRELRPRMMEQLRPGTRVVAFRFPIMGWKPARIETTEGDDVFLYVMPAPADR